MEPLALTRPESEDDRHYVRHQCGYGCVRCAATVWEYRSASGSSDVEEIVLLCPACARALDGQPGAERAMRTLRANPLPRQRMFDRRKLPYANDIPDITLVPGATMHNTPVPILFAGMPVLRVGPPEVQGGALTLGIALGRADGEPEALVIANEWVGGPEWTFDRPGNKYVVTSRDRSAQLILATITPHHLAVELLRTHGGGRMLESGLHGTRVDGVAIPTPAAKSQFVGMSA